MISRTWRRWLHVAALDAAEHGVRLPRITASAAITVVLVRTTVRAASGVTPRRPATST